MFTRDGLFGFDGRIRRSEWWMTGLAVGLLGLMVLAAYRFGTAGDRWPVPGEQGFFLKTAIEFIVMAPFLWVQTALNVKRGHDLNIPAWPLLAFQVFAVGSTYVPLFLPLGPSGDRIIFGIDIAYWVGFGIEVIVLGFIRGTVGTNRYGASTFDINTPVFSEPGGVE